MFRWPRISPVDATAFCVFSKFRRAEWPHRTFLAPRRALFGRATINLSELKSKNCFYSFETTLQSNKKKFIKKRVIRASCLLQAAFIVRLKSRAHGLWSRMNSWSCSTDRDSPSCWASRCAAVGSSASVESCAGRNTSSAWPPDWEATSACC